MVAGQEKREKQEAYLGVEETAASEQGTRNKSDDFKADISEIVSGGEKETEKAAAERSGNETTTVEGKTKKRELIPLWLFLFFLGSLLYLEVVFHLLHFGLPEGDFLYSCLFLPAAAALAGILSSFGGRKLRKVISFSMISLFCLLYMVQQVYCSVFKTYMTLFSLTTGTGQVMEFWREILLAIGSNLHWLVFYLLPIGALGFFWFLWGKKTASVNEAESGSEPAGTEVGDGVAEEMPADQKQSEQKVSGKLWMWRGILFGVMLVFHIGTVLGLPLLGTDFYTSYDLYHYTPAIDISVRKLGLLTTFRLDAKRLLFGLEEPEIEDNSGEWTDESETDGGNDGELTDGSGADGETGETGGDGAQGGTSSGDGSQVDGATGPAIDGTGENGGDNSNNGNSESENTGSAGNSDGTGNSGSESGAGPAGGNGNTSDSNNKPAGGNENAGAGTGTGENGSDHSGNGNSESENSGETGANTLPIDFDGLIESAPNKTVADMHKYFKKADVTNKNKYTGMFEGYNLILITAEGFSPYAVHEEVTPTLYKLSKEGFVFTNFYTPLWGVSTSDGEYVACTGLIPKSGVWSFYRSGSNYMPFGFGNQFRRLGYQCRAYHNHTFDYYNRDISHPNMGYDYKGVGNGLNMTKTWPESDLEMMELTVPEYIEGEPFHTYYMTVSGHMNYSFLGNTMANKNRDAVKDLPYSETAKAYIACNIELDRALEKLIADLTEAGIMDRTVIALSADHYPYGMEKEVLDELAGHEVEKNFEIYRNHFFLWTSSMKEPVIVDKVAGSMDIAPTICNLFGLEYDSRLYMGKDILSEESDGLVIFSNRSFISDKVMYNAVSGKTTMLTDEPLPKGYIKKMNQKVSQKFQYSAKILEQDYFKYFKDLWEE